MDKISNKILKEANLASIEKFVPSQRGQQALQPEQPPRQVQQPKQAARMRYDDDKIVLSRIQVILDQKGTIKINPQNIKRIDIVKELQDIHYKLSKTLQITAAKGHMKEGLTSKLAVFLAGDKKTKESRESQQQSPQIPLKIPTVITLGEDSNRLTKEISEAITRSTSSSNASLVKAIESLQQTISRQTTNKPETELDRQLKTQQIKLLEQQIGLTEQNRQAKLTQQANIKLKNDLQNKILEAQVLSFTAKAKYDIQQAKLTELTTNITKLKETKNLLTSSNFENVRAEGLLKTIEDQIIYSWEKLYGNKHLSANVDQAKDVALLKLQKQAEEDKYKEEANYIDRQIFLAKNRSLNLTDYDLQVLVPKLTGKGSYQQLKDKSNSKGTKKQLTLPTPLVSYQQLQYREEDEHDNDQGYNYY